MFLKQDDGWITDSFTHEQSLVLECGDGIVILNSCSHGGADNIIREVSAEYPGRRVLAMIGGFHLHNKDDDYIRAFAEKLRHTGVGQIYTGHCTGDNGFRILSRELGGMVHQLRVGLEIDF